MAPRLRRWALITVAGSLLVTWLLLPSGRSILFGSWGPDRAEETPLEARQSAVAAALWRAQAELDRRRQLVELEKVVRIARARGEDPVVYARDTSAVKVQRGVGGQLAGLWGRLSARNPELLTVVALGGGWNVNLDSVTNDSLCVADVHAVDGRFSWSKEEVNWSVGGCSLRERYGSPGRAWSRWLESTPALRVDLTRGPYTRLASTREEPRPWFGGPGGGMWDEWGLGTLRARVLVSCAGGNAVSCRSAFGVGGTDSAAKAIESVRYLSSVGRFDSRAALPGAIYRDLGDAGFALLWRTDTTIAAGYEQISGKPIDGLLQRIAFAMVGPRPRDIGLSPVALVGAVCWVVLLGAWAAYRLRERRIGW
jgi:hypothetical protein